MGSDYLQQLWAGLEERICTCGAGHGSNEAHHIGCEWLEYHSTAELLMAMRDAGYRILAPGELDAETLDRAAQVVERPVVGYRDSTTNDNAPPTKCSIQDAT